MNIILHIFIFLNKSYLILIINNNLFRLYLYLIFLKALKSYSIIYYFIKLNLTSVFIRLINHNKSLFEYNGTRL